jgi:glycosyltransferase involved in cell wall biosynthesis
MSGFAPPLRVAFNARLGAEENEDLEVYLNSVGHQNRIALAGVESSSRNACAWRQEDLYPLEKMIDPSETPNSEPCGQPEAPSSAAVEVSVVIPCLNEAESIAFCVDQALAGLRVAKVRGEVLVVDNGCSDASAKIAAEHGARVVKASIKGVGSASRVGIQAAQGEFVILGDADGSHDFSEIPRFVVKWREGFEFIVGNRFQGGVKDGAMRWHHRYIGTPALSALLNLFFRSGVNDINCGMRGLTKDLYRRLDLRTAGFEFCSESVIKAAKLGARIAEAPITAWPDRRGRPPHLRTFHDGWRHLRFILLYAPNWLFLLPGCLLVILSIGLVLWLLPGPRVAGGVGLDIHTMGLAMMLALLGTHIISVGMFVKVFCYTERFSHHQPSVAKWLKTVKLEYGLLVGAVMVVTGLAGDAIVFWKWAAGGFGTLHPVRTVFFCSLSFILGIEVLFSSVFLSMLGINRDTYIGD